MTDYVGRLEAQEIHRKRLFRALATTGLILVVLSGELHAQQRADFDLSSSFSVLPNGRFVQNYLHESYGTTLHGVVVSSARYPAPWFGLLAEGGIGRRLLSLGVGPRLIIPVGRITPFAQVLLGVASADDNVLGGESTFGVFAYQPGGGADFWLRQNLAFRVAVDYFAPETGHRYAKRRYAAGLVFRRRPH
jgi:hypothetical protein